MRLEILAGWTRVWSVAKELLAGFSLIAGGGGGEETVAN